MAVDTRDEFADLFSLYAPLLVAVTGIVLLLVVFAVLRYRRRPGREPARRSDRKVVELLYAAALAVIAALLVAATFSAERRVDALSPRPGLVVDVVAFKWQWRFSYVDSGVALVGTRERPARLAVPTGTTVRFRMTSRDVIHAFWIPELRFKRDAFPRRTTSFDLVFSKPGRITGRCAEFCGLRHADMTFDVEAMPPSDFEAWLSEQEPAA